MIVILWKANTVQHKAAETDISETSPRKIHVNHLVRRKLFPPESVAIEHYVAKLSPEDAVDEVAPLKIDVGQLCTAEEALLEYRGLVNRPTHISTREIHSPIKAEPVVLDAP